MGFDWDCCSEGSIRVVMLAQEEARRLGHNFVDGGMILVGLSLEGKGRASQALKELGVSKNDLRSHLERIIGRGDHIATGDVVPLTPAAKKILTLAKDKSQISRSPEVETEHLLLAIAETSGVGQRVLENLGIRVVKLRDKLNV
ncbi:MAG TPA: Clp protease N-terminal domain-containing protein [Planktothrix sp.]|jgi:ATP-dependent Clp protease ATP-binding subunit ClpC